MIKPVPRTSARARAQRAKSRRDSAQAVREQAIEAALTDYYQAVANADRIRDAARRRADAALSDAEQAAAPEDEAGREAVRRLRALLSVQEIAELCGLSQWAVREMLSDGRTRADEDGESKTDHAAGNPQEGSAGFPGSTE